MNVARLNTAHIEIDDANHIIKNIRSVSDRIGILIDTKGQKLGYVNLKVHSKYLKGNSLLSLYRKIQILDLW